jgi:hypothetical protein
LLSTTPLPSSTPLPVSVVNSTNNHAAWWNPATRALQRCVVGSVDHPASTQLLLAHFMPWLVNSSSAVSSNRDGGGDGDGEHVESLASLFELGDAELTAVSVAMCSVVLRRVVLVVATTGAWLCGLCLLHWRFFLYYW